MRFDLPTVILIIITSCVCTTGFVGVIILYVVDSKKRMKEGDHLVRDLERFAKDNPGPLPVATRLLLGIYLFISLSVLGLLLVMVVIILAYQGGLPLANNINVESLGLISSVILLVAIIATLILRILFKKIFKSR